MRLWHTLLLPYLPKSQLAAQKRECDVIWRDIGRGVKTNHILINYIWSYDVEEFTIYYAFLKREFDRRGFKFRPHSAAKVVEYSSELRTPFEYHHNAGYMRQCFYNLQEKYERGQKDFDEDIYDALEQFVHFWIHIEEVDEYERIQKEN